MMSVREISNCRNAVVPNYGSDGAWRSSGETGDNAEPTRGVSRDQGPAADILFTVALTKRVPGASELQWPTTASGMMTDKQQYPDFTFPEALLCRRDGGRRHPQ